MSDHILWILLALLLGILIGWLLHRIFFSQKNVDPSLLEEARTGMIREQEQHQLTRQQLQELQGIRTQLQTRLEELQQETAAIRERLVHQQESLAEKDQSVRKLQEEQTRHQQQFIQQEKENAELRADNRSLQEKLRTFDEELTRKFEVLSQQILDDKSKKFTELNKEQISRVMQPFEKEIKEFKEKVNETYITESKERFKLQGEIEKLMQLNQQLSDDARNLTRALTVDTKQQGDWGEMILEKILEQSGLVKGREFTMQESMQDAEGNRLRTDVIIKLPDERNIIIDSKVSLTDYDRFMKADDADEQEAALQRHVRSVKGHVDILHKKSYADYPGSPEFIFMFIPVEPAFMVAMQGDPELWNYAYQKNIILIGPTNLIAALKLVAEIWKKEYQSRNAMEIADRAGALYDKFAGFTESLLDVGKNLGKAGESYDKALSQLKDGKGNLIGRVEQLRKLGAKNKKQLDQQLLLPDDDIQDDD